MAEGCERMPLWVRALCALADWLSRGVWDAQQWCKDWSFAQQKDENDKVVVLFEYPDGVQWTGWRPIRLGEDWPRWLTG